MNNPAASSVVSQELALQEAWNYPRIYPARLCLGDNSTIKFQCTSFLKFGSH